MYSTEYIKNILKHITEYTRIYVIRTPPILIRTPPAPGYLSLPILGVSCMHFRQFLLDFWMESRVYPSSRCSAGLYCNPA